MVGFLSTLLTKIGGRQADATVMAATAAAAAASPSARPVARPASGHTALRRSGSLMDFNGGEKALL